MTKIIVNENTEQGQAILSLVKTLPKKTASIIDDDDDISDCISSEEFQKLMLVDLKKKYDQKKNKK
jgi:hypothetical protein